MKSLWVQTVKRPSFERLRGDAKTDVLIIGGGMTGVLCAYLLNQAGVDCLLAEADKICGGVTENTTAKLTVGHGLIYDRLTRTRGREAARLYLSANSAALKKYRELCRGKDYGFEEQDSYIYSTDDREKIEREAEALTSLGFAAELVSELPLPLQIAAAVKAPRQAQINPLELAFALAGGLNIKEHTKVLELTPDGAVTAGGTIKAQKIIVATHFPFLNKHGSYYLKLYQHRSYVLALKNVPVLPGMYADEASGGFSFRGYGDILLLGGGGGRTGKRSGGWKKAEDFARRNYPGYREVCRWATQDCMSLDGVPYIGRYSRRTENLYTATGYNKWGMTSSMAAAMLLTELVQGKSSPYSELFSPSRSLLHPQLFINAGEAAAGLLTPTVPRCPHLGCALKYNRQEHSWDCSCHGSRFSEEGELIENPASSDNKGIKKRKGLR